MPRARRARRRPQVRRGDAGSLRGTARAHRPAWPRPADRAQDQPRYGVPRAVGAAGVGGCRDFHNISMTYLPARWQATPLRRSAPRQAGAALRSRGALPGPAVTAAPALRAIYRPTVTGLEHVPPSGPVILASNHISFADEVFIPTVARRQVFYFAKAEYFTTPGIRGRADGEHIPRHGPAAGRARRHPLRGVGGRHRRRGAGPGQGAGDLPRRHPLARRAALPLPHGRRAAGAALRCASGAGGHGRHPRRTAAGEQALAPGAGRGALRHADALRAPGRRGAQLAGAARDHREHPHGGAVHVPAGVRRRVRLEHQEENIRPKGEPF